MPLPLDGFPQRLRRLREGRHWARPDLAARVGRGTNAIYHYERGNALPDYETALRLAMLFGLTTDALMRDDWHGPLECSEQEATLLHHFRACPAPVRQALLHLLRQCAQTVCLPTSPASPSHNAHTAP